MAEVVVVRPATTSTTTALVACGGRANFSVCDGLCVDTANDPQNCASCGHKCAPGQACTASVCH